MIEKIIHVYYGKIKTESPYSIKNKMILPNYQFMEWDDDKLMDFCEKNGLPKNNMMIRVVCKLGGFFIDNNYEFLRNIDVFLLHDFLSVFDSSGIKLNFYGSKKDNQIINKIFKINNRYDDTYIRDYKNNKIVNPIYLYPEKYMKHYSIVEVHKDYIFGANHNYSPWVFDSKFTKCKTSFRYNVEPYRFLSNIVYSRTRPEQKRNILLVIAHPDDDMIFFGELLIYRHSQIKVICITCSSVMNRYNEFLKVMNNLDIDYEIWDVYNIKSYHNADVVKNKLIQAIKGFEIFFTHSLSGETGHPTHIMINRILFDIVPVNLFVSNPFRNKSFLHPKKMEILKYYASQRGIINMYTNLVAREDYLRVK